MTDVPTVNVILAWKAFRNSCSIKNAGIDAKYGTCISVGYALEFYTSMLYLEHFPSLPIVRKVGHSGCSTIALAWVGVFWALHTTWDDVTDLNSVAALTARNRVRQYL